MQQSQQQMVMALKKQEEFYLNKISKFSQFNTNSEFDFIQNPIQPNQPQILTQNGKQVILKQISHQDDNSQIVSMLQNINKLNKMLIHINSLCQSQGQIVDRIDFNIQKTVERVVKGKK